MLNLKFKIKEKMDSQIDNEQVIEKIHAEVEGISEERETIFEMGGKRFAADTSSSKTLKGYLFPTLVEQVNAPNVSNEKTVKDLLVKESTTENRINEQL